MRWLVSIWNEIFFMTFNFFTELDEIEVNFIFEDIVRYIQHLNGIVKIEVIYMEVPS